MYNIWCEVKKTNIILITIGIFFSIIELFVGNKYNYSILIITLLLIAYLIKCIFKFFSLKKNGILIDNIQYEFKELKNKEKILIINYQLDTGNCIQLFKKKTNWKSTQNTGTTKLLINPSNIKQYFIFDPKDN